MTLNNAQATVDNWIKTIGIRYFHEMTNMAILTEEVGEVARLMSRMYGEQSFKKTENAENAKEN
jgi:NTP pyrophosphatase (non-canonical NTP hydrolase)